MHLSVRSEVHQGVSILVVTGILDMSTSAQLTRAAAQMLEGGPDEVVLDLGGVTFMDSSGLGVIVGMWKHARARGRSLHLICEGAYPLRLFAITGLTRVLTVYPNRETLLRDWRAHTTASDAVGGVSVP